MKLRYHEGTAFLVPLRRGGGFARGIIARASPRGGVLFGYLFGPVLNQPSLTTIDDLQPSRAVLRVRFGDLGLLQGHWPILGDVPDWKRADWPMPDFATREPLGKPRIWLVRYSDNNPNHRVETKLIDDDSGLDTDSLYGYGAVEITLTKILVC